MIEALSSKVMGDKWTGTEGVIKSYNDLTTMFATSRKTSITSGKNFQGLSDGYISIILSDEPPVVNLTGGTPWGSYMVGYTSGKIAIQHSAPTLDIWNMLNRDRTEIMLRIGPAVSSKSYSGISRNGVSTSSFTNGSSQGYTPGWYVGDFIYWNSMTRRVERNSPRNKEAVPRLFDGILLT